MRTTVIKKYIYIKKLRSCVSFQYVMKMATALNLAVILACTAAASGGHDYLPRASASPVNVDPSVDCAIKELALEYAQFLQPEVSLW